jgi:DNA-binding NtrC family response regulator
VSTASTLLDQQTAKGAAAQAFRVLVMTPDLCSSQPLVADRILLIGRAPDSDIVLGDARASRRHARLTFDARGLGIEDLGSANGTRLRDQKLPAHQRTSLLPGEAIAIGKTILMVLPSATESTPRALLCHEDFEGRVEWECARAAATGARFTLLRLRASPETDLGQLATAVSRALRPMDLVGQYGPGQVEALLPGLDADGAAIVHRDLLDRLANAGIPGQVGIAGYPRDGRHAHALLAHAGAAWSLDSSPARSHDWAHTASAAMRDLLGLAERAAAGHINLLILGETGAGKDVLAHWIHAHSPRAHRAFVCVDCAALSASLLESELYGHERGAFTGAGSAKPGLLETAPGGTLFLDEVGEMPLPLQAKLLRAIENCEITRVGGVRPRKIDVRFLAASNRDLAAAATSGTFRSDLYYRLNGMTLTVPPLRERAEDIPLLAAGLIAERCRADKRRAPVLEQSTLDLLCAYTWPGNVRELRNMVDRALLLCTGERLTVEHFSEATLRRQSLTLPPAPTSTPPGSERERIVAALAACAGNQSRAARQLGISRKLLVARLDRHGIARPRKPGGS